jgi:hypothetical protein
MRQGYCVKIIKSGWLAASLCCSFAARAATLETPLFSVQAVLPWHVYSNEPGLLVLAGSEVLVDGVPLPGMMVQYCATRADEADGLTACSDSCEDGARKILTELSETMQLQPLQQTDRGQGVVEYHTTGLARDGRRAATLGFSCSATGHAYLSLVAEDTSSVREQFDAILRSLQWFSPQSP